MSQDIKTLLNAEEEMTKAIARINTAVEDMRKFQSASKTLENASQRCETVLKALLQVSQHCESGARLLKDDGIAAFRAELVQTVDRGVKAQQDVIAELSTELKLTNSQLGTAIPALTSSIASLEAQMSQVQSTLRRTTVLIIITLLLAIGIMGCIAWSLSHQT